MLMGFQTSAYKISVVFFILVNLGELIFARNQRSTQELNRCISIADPLIHDPDYVFPLSVREIRSVCRKWDEFVDCVKQYTAVFLTSHQQREFDNIIQPSMRSIHQLCIQDAKYEQAYLHYAPCMKTISIEERFCGTHYNFLAKLAESSADTGPAICCGYHKFRNCVLREAKRECEGNEDSRGVSHQGDSTRFVSSMLNRALGFLLQKCEPNQSETQDCLASLTGGRESKINTIDDTDPNYNGGDSRSPNPPSVRAGSFAPVSTNDNTENYNYKPRYPSSWSPSYFPGGQTTLTPSNVANKRPSPVTVNPPTPFQGRHPFTWTTTPRPSFFPTRNTTFGDFLSNEIREPERYHGPSGDNTALINTASLSVLLGTLFVGLMLQVRDHQDIMAL